MPYFQELRDRLKRVQEEKEKSLKKRSEMLAEEVKVSFPCTVTQCIVLCT
jgi:hypothetical protein